MYAEKFELLEARIRETAMFVARLREEKQQLEQENAVLRARLAALEEQLRSVAGEDEQYAPQLDSLLAQLDTLREGDVLQPFDAPSPSTAPPPVAADTEATPAPVAFEEEDPLLLAMRHEHHGRHEQAITLYQRLLEADSYHLEAAQRLAILLEKLNRDAEAAALWDKIWAMQAGQTSLKRRRLL